MSPIFIARLALSKILFTKPTSTKVYRPLKPINRSIWPQKIITQQYFYVHNYGTFWASTQDFEFIQINEISITFSIIT